MVVNPITQFNWTRKIGAGVNKFEAICIHWWNAKELDPLFEDVLHHLAYSTVQVSAHFVLEGGRVAQLARPNQVTWHAAQSRPSQVNMNSRWVGIECNAQCDDDDVLDAARLIAHLWKIKGRPVPLVKHKDSINTYCPGPEWSWWVNSGELYKLAQQAYQGKEIKMGTAANVWNFNVRGRNGRALHAQDFLSGMADDIVSNVKNWVWDGEIQNFLGDNHKIRYIIRAMDSNICDNVRTLAEVKATQQVILEALAKLGGIDQQEIEKAVARNMEKALTEANEAMNASMEVVETAV